MIKKTNFLLGLMIISLMSFQFNLNALVPKENIKTKKSSLTNEAEKFIQGLGDQVISDIIDHNISEQDRRKKFQHLFGDSFDTIAIGKFVLGRHRRQAKPEDLKDFFELVKNAIVDKYSSRFKKFNNHKFVVTGSTASVDKKNTTVVKSNIIGPNDEIISVSWNTYLKKNGEIKIYDVVIVGASMAATQRSEYSEILQSQGLKGLNQHLKENHSK